MESVYLLNINKGTRIVHSDERRIGEAGQTSCRGVAVSVQSCGGYSIEGINLYLEEART